MNDEKLSEEISQALDRYNKCVLLDPEAAAVRLFETHSEILTTHQCDLNIEFANKIING